MTNAKFCSCEGKIVVNYTTVSKKSEAVIYNEHKISNIGQFRI